MPPIAEITFNQNTLAWLGGPLIASLAVLIAGLLVRRRSPRTGFVLVLVGIGGLILSAGWVAFAFYVDAVLGDT
jgi:CHASE2 domain-containing sensor protein